MASFNIGQPQIHFFVIIFVILFCTKILYTTGITCICENCSSTTKTSNNESVCHSDVDTCAVEYIYYEDKLLLSRYCLRRFKDLRLDVQKLMMCNGRANNKTSLLCCEEELCNRALLPAYPLDYVRSTVDSTTPHISDPALDQPWWQNHTLLLISASVFLALSVLIIMFLLYYRCGASRRKVVWKRGILPSFKKASAPSNQQLLSEDVQDSSLQCLISDLTMSGSGSGLPLMIQRTIAWQINLIERIGTGRFGHVWKGLWQTDLVAVKIFNSRVSQSWMRETEIYQTIMLRHENILGFIAADNKDIGSSMELWLVADYHQHGSLFDYLSVNTVDVSRLVHFTNSIICGLSHLHREIMGVQGKPAIAHRDLKTRNILVKNDDRCCIADLGLAVRHNIDVPKRKQPVSDSIPSTNRMDNTVPLNNEVGTVRYMAPEVLSNTMHWQLFDSYKKADMYSFALVIWEILTRCSVDGGFQDYQLPYQDIFDKDPSVAEMKQIVCDENLRPTMPTRLLKSDMPVLETIIKMTRECWTQESAARLTALRVKKSMAHMVECMYQSDNKKTSLV